MNRNESVLVFGRGVAAARQLKTVPIHRNVMGPPIQPPRKTKRKEYCKSTCTTSSPSTGINWKHQKNSTQNKSSIAVTGSASRTHTTSTSEPESKVIIAITEARGDALSEVGIAAINIAQPSLILCQISDSKSYIKTLTKINILNPSEILIPLTFIDSPTTSRLTEKIKEQFFDVKITGIARSSFTKSTGLQYIKRLCLPSMDSIILILQHRYYALAAAAALLTYAETRLYVFYGKQSIKVEYQESEGCTIIDVATADRLELVASARPTIKKRYSCLLDILNHCQTKIGLRTLRATILQPPCSVPDIEERLNCVTELMERNMLAEIQAILSKLANIDQLLTLATVLPDQAQNSSERQINYLLLLNTILGQIDPLRDVFENSTQPFFVELRTSLENPAFGILQTDIQSLIQVDAYAAKGQNGVMQRCFAIKPGINSLLDLVRKSYTERLDDLREYVKTLARKYNLTLNLHNNNKKGFHIILNLSVHQKRSLKKTDLPAEFIQVERLANSYSMKTGDLINLSHQIEDIMVEILKMGNIMIYELLIRTRAYLGVFFKLCEDVAKLDMLQSLAKASSAIYYVRPKFDEYLEVEQARHPLLDFLCSVEPTANSYSASNHNNISIITGANGSGKSIFIRQIVLIQVMAQVGCYVPARSAVFRVADRILARVYLEDNLDCGASAFMLEMKEMKYFLTVLTKNTIIIIDELCRSTSVEEGTAIAMAICEELLRTCAFSFFTTHFKFLTKLQELHCNITTLQLETIVETEDDKTTLNFTYNVVEGITSLEHYGILLAAGSWPKNIVAYAQTILKELITTTRKKSLPQIKLTDSPTQLLYNLEAEFNMLKSKKQLTTALINQKLLEYQTNLHKLGYNIELRDDLTPNAIDPEIQDNQNQQRMITDSFQNPSIINEHYSNVISDQRNYANFSYQADNSFSFTKESFSALENSKCDRYSHRNLFEPEVIIRTNEDISISNSPFYKQTLFSNNRENSGQLQKTLFEINNTVNRPKRNTTREGFQFLRENFNVNNNNSQNEFWRRNSNSSLPNGHHDLFETRNNNMLPENPFISRENSVGINSQPFFSFNNSYGTQNSFQTPQFYSNKNERTPNVVKRRLHDICNKEEPWEKNTSLPNEHHDLLETRNNNMLPEDPFKSRENSVGINSQPFFSFNNSYGTQNSFQTPQFYSNKNERTPNVVKRRLHDICNKEEPWEKNVSQNSLQSITEQQFSLALKKNRHKTSTPINFIASGNFNFTHEANSMENKPKSTSNSSRSIKWVFKQNNATEVPKPSAVNKERDLLTNSASGKSVPENEQTKSSSSINWGIKSMKSNVVDEKLKTLKTATPINLIVGSNFNIDHEANSMENKPKSISNSSQSIKWTFKQNNTTEIPKPSAVNEEENFENSSNKHSSLLINSASSKSVANNEQTKLSSSINWGIKSMKSNVVDEKLETLKTATPINLIVGSNFNIDHEANSMENKPKSVSNSSQSIKWTFKQNNTTEIPKPSAINKEENFENSSNKHSSLLINSASSKSVANNEQTKLSSSINWGIKSKKSDVVDEKPETLQLSNKITTIEPTTKKITILQNIRLNDIVFKNEELPKEEAKIESKENRSEIDLIELTNDLQSNYSEYFESNDWDFVDKEIHAMLTQENVEEQLRNSNKNFKDGQHLSKSPVNPLQNESWTNPDCEIAEYTRKMEQERRNCNENLQDTKNLYKSPEYPYQNESLGCEIAEYAGNLVQERRNSNKNLKDPKSLYKNSEYPFQNDSLSDSDCKIVEYIEKCEHESQNRCENLKDSNISFNKNPAKVLQNGSSSKSDWKIAECTGNERVYRNGHEHIQNISETGCKITEYNRIIDKESQNPNNNLIITDIRNPSLPNTCKIVVPGVNPEKQIEQSKQKSQNFAENLRNENIEPKTQNFEGKGENTGKVCDSQGNQNLLQHSQLNIDQISQKSRNFARNLKNIKNFRIFKENLFQTGENYCSTPKFTEPTEKSQNLNESPKQTNNVCNSQETTCPIVCPTSESNYAEDRESSEVRKEITSSENVLEPLGDIHLELFSDESVIEISQQCQKSRNVNTSGEYQTANDKTCGNTTTSLLQKRKRKRLGYVTKKVPVSSTTSNDNTASENATSEKNNSKRSKWAPPFKKTSSATKTKFKPYTKKEIELDFYEQNKEMLESGNSSECFERLMSRPSVRQLRQIKHIASIRKTNDGVIVVPAVRKEPRKRKQKFVTPLRFKSGNFDISASLLTDKNSDKFQKLMNSTIENPTPITRQNVASQFITSGVVTKNGNKEGYDKENSITDGFSSFGKNINEFKTTLLNKLKKTPVESTHLHQNSIQLDNIINKYLNTENRENNSSNTSSSSVY